MPPIDAARHAAGFAPARHLSVLAAFIVLLIGLSVIRPAAADDQAVIWAHNFGTSGADATLLKTVRDSAGNLYATGTYTGGTLALGGVPALTRLGVQDAFVVKFDAAGNVVWANNIGGVGATAQAQQVVLDSAGNVIVAGYYSGGNLTDGGVIQNSGSGGDGFIIKYDASGNTTWGRSLGDTTTTTIINAVAIDSADNINVVGNFAGGNLTAAGFTLVGAADGFVIQYDASGNLTNSRQFGGTGATIVPTSIAASGTTLYVGGHFRNGDMTFSPILLSRIGSGQTGFMLRFTGSLTPNWRQNFGGSGATIATGSIALDSGGNVIVAGNFSGTAMSTPALSRLTASGKTGFVLKATPTGATTTSFAWVKNIGGPAVDTSLQQAVVDGADNVHVVGDFTGDNLTSPALDLIGTAATVLVKLAGTDGTLSDPAAFGGTSAFGSGIAVDAIGNAFLVGNMTGNLTTPALNLIGAKDGYILRYGPRYTLAAVKAGTGSGAVAADSGALSCGLTCQDNYANGLVVTLTATPATGSTFAGWSGYCSGATASIAVTMSEARNCTATFTLIPTPPPSPSGPSAPAPAPTVVDLPVNANSAGQGSVALAAALGDPAPGAVIAVTQASGAPLPGWLVFDRAGLTLSFNVPLPGDLPTQPIADTRAARATPPNLVYPLAVQVQAVPVMLVVDGQAFVFNMDFYAPRGMVAASALSYSATGTSGDGASGKPAISWDGGQVLFETAANNLFGAFSAETKIARYHGLSGKRDLLSQTAVPGGGVANASIGPATAPAVTPNGAFGVFAAAGGGITLAPASTLKQIYRTSLVYPRVLLNEAATPTPIMVSTSATGQPANAPADKPAISEDGRFVAFESAATNLGWNQGGSQIWRKDVATGAVVLVSANAQGTAGNGDSRNVAISWDGRFAAFESSATNLVTGAAGQQIYLKDLGTGALFVIAAGTAPKLDARATTIVFVAQGQIQRYDVATGRVTTFGPGDQPTMSADGRFVAWRAAGTVFTQIWVRDIFRDVTALVSQTATSAQGGGNSYDPALSGDGASIAFGSQARDLVNGNPLPGQIHLAGNPLALPARTGHWYVPSGGNQAWAIERWGDRAYVANLAYQPAGPASWTAGLCAFVDLGCKGTLNPLGLSLATWFPAGNQAVASVNSAANQPLQFYPVLGTATSAMPGLPQSGWWYDPANTGSGVFLQVATQAARDGALSHTAHLSLLGQDNAWYAAEGTLGSDLSLEGTLYAYAGGAPLGQMTGSPAPSATAIGQYRLTFTANDRATLHLPAGSIRSLVRFRF